MYTNINIARMHVIDSVALFMLYIECFDGTWRCIIVECSLIQFSILALALITH